MRKINWDTIGIWSFPIILWILAIVLMCSCTTTRYIPVVSTRDSVRLVENHDTLLAHDSVYMERYLQGDTVYVTKYKYKTLYRTKVRTDSVMVMKTDTVTLVRDLTGKTEKTSRPWWKTLKVFGIITVCCIAIVTFIRKFKFS